MADDQKQSVDVSVPSQQTEDTKELEEEVKETEWKFPVQVFVRIRPLVGAEINDKHDAVEFTVKAMKHSETETLSLKKVAGKNKDRDYTCSALQRVILPSMNNLETFDRCLLPSASPCVFKGEKVCVLAYGHTGSGKTHTIFGYPKENVPGMYGLFAKHMFNDARIKDSEDICVEVRFVELYQEKVFDLLSAEKTECFLRESIDGEMILRAPPKKCADHKIRAYPISSVHVKSAQELLSVIADGIASRNVGHSTLHDKSSRSHAFLEFEIVSNALVEERKKLIESEADILLNELMMDKPNYKLLVKKYKTRDKIPKARLRMVEMLEGIEYPRDWKVMDKMKKSLAVEQQQIRQNLKELSRDKDRPYIGGTMIFVDLAGNEYGRDVTSKDVQEERERNAINQSLLALKECIRGLHANKTHIGYRNSTLTKYLRPYLDGTDSKAIMISNIGSSQNYAKQSINTLQYTQLVAKA
eukprot:CAMPEP_0202694070 /NCGR_PEP_ID=MMETSP1385-20130828/8025_1 /ASSEMBLY_ACC=CAM_ASM_000861 /TAXON_ID=933848 /ORGANISM="Elphidium margaritaceum" /LENGTH=470 /DNA_ID=CAMNT_0049349849 /DNA_START=14 /DNA_END=1426 /DNA_ORIENTATION=+